jgi:hypothetical protein
LLHWGEKDEIVGGKVMKRSMFVLLFVSVFCVSGIFAESKISYSDLSYLNKEVNAGHYVSSLVLGGTMNLYAGNTMTGVTLTAIKMLSYGMIAYGKMNFYESQSVSVSTSDSTVPGGAKSTSAGQTIAAPSINYISLGILVGGIFVSGITSAYDIVTGLDAIETKKAEIIKRNSIELNISSAGTQNQISVGIKF